MARINIEETWWTDLRRSKLSKLMGSEDLADAAAIRMWRLAQGFWKDGKRLVPTQIWAHFEPGQKCVDAGLAIVEGDFIYVRGSSEYFEWILEQKAKSKKGGLKSAEARKKKTGTAQPIGGKGAEEPNQNRTKSEPEPKLSEPSYSYSYSSSSSSSSSNSDSNSISSSDVKGEQKKRKSSTSVPGEDVSVAVSAYCVSWKERYGASPPISGKVSGQIKQLVKDHGLTKAIGFITAYLEMPDQWFLTRRHDIPTLIGNLNSVAQFIETGRMITRKETRDADSTASMQNQLHRIAQGEL